MRRYMPLTGGLTVIVAVVLIVLGVVLASYDEVGSAVLLVAMGLGGLELVPVGFWIVRRQEPRKEGAKPGYAKGISRLIRPDRLRPE